MSIGEQPDDGCDGSATSPDAGARPPAGPPGVVVGGGRARALLAEATAEQRERLGRALRGAGFADLHTVATLADAERLLLARSHGAHCDLDLVVMDEALFAASAEAPPPSWRANPALRDLPVLAMQEDQPRPWPATRCEVVGREPAAVAGRARALVETRRELLRLRRLLDIGGCFLMTLTDDGRVESVNQGGSSLLGRSAGDLAGTDWFAECVPQDAARDARAQFETALQATPGSVLEDEYPVRTGADEERLLAWRYCPWMDVDGRVRRVLCAGRDVTERNEMRELLSWHASHDLLTSLYNRSGFEKRLAGALDAAREDHREHALCFIDIDQFKVINDTCGYEAGDELLRLLGGLLDQNLGDDDLVARLGADQFAVLMQDRRPREALHAAARVQSAVEGFRFPWRGRVYRLGASIGVVGIDAESGSAASVLAAADAACHAAKQQGGGRTRLYQSDDEDVVARKGEVQWVLRIKRALDENRFQLWLQPIERIGSVGGDHYELLLRMVDDDGSVVLPGVFLPAAERFHLSTRIDRWVIRNAFAWLAREARDDGVLCCINLSGLSLADESFLDYTVRELHRHGIAGKRVCFEITETAAIGNLSGAIRFIRALKAQGVCFALDDFGSGLSSFAYLKTLPVDFLKIDGAFVKDIADSPIDFAMVKSIHEVARVMGKETIGEFVESAHVLSRLREIGVHFAQGYAVGEPRRLET